MLSDYIEKVSYSNISTFLQCQRKWKLTYIDKLDKKQDSADTIYGTVIHEAIQKFLHYYYSNTLTTLQANKQKLLEQYSIFIMNGLEQGFIKKLNLSYQITEQYLGYGMELIKQFIPHVNKWFSKSGMELQGTEIQLNINEPNWKIRFNGYIDILLHDKKNNRYKIIDLKTSRTSWNDNQKNDQVKRLQLLLYKIFLSQLKSIPLQNIDIEFLILKKIVFQGQYKVSRIQKYQPPHGKATINKAVKLFNETLKEMEILCESKLQGEMNPTNYCNWCSFYKEKQLCSRKRTIKK